MRRRWDIDERGRGVADAAPLVPHAEMLLQSMSERDWVTEQPDAHLLPHILRAAESFPLKPVADRIDSEGVLEVEFRWTVPWDRGAANIALFALLGSFAEEMTYLRSEATETSLELELVTGVVSEGHFAPHGHTVRLRISPGEG